MFASFSKGACALALLSSLVFMGCPAKTQSAKTQSAKTKSADKPEPGDAIYKRTCAICHGPDAKGLPKLGQNLITSEFVKKSSDEELLAFVKKGRTADDPASKTKVAMPPMGMAKSDDEIKRVIKYLRTLK